MEMQSAINSNGYKQCDEGKAAGCLYCCWFCCCYCYIITCIIMMIHPGKLSNLVLIDSLFSQPLQCHSSAYTRHKRYSYTIGTHYRPLHTFYVFFLFAICLHICSHSVNVSFILICFLCLCPIVFLCSGHWIIQPSESFVFLFFHFLELLLLLCVDSSRFGAWEPNSKLLRNGK